MVTPQADTVVRSNLHNHETFDLFLNSALPSMATYEQKRSYMNATICNLGIIHFFRHVLYFVRERVSFKA
eukprot:5606241-Amphidinium_carterae.1